MYAFAHTGYRVAAIILGAVFLTGTLAAEPITLMDDRGQSLTLPNPARQPAAISTFGADVSLALGVKPVATTRYGVQGLPDYLQTELQGVANLGPRHQPNLEILSRVKPDLIFSIRRYTEKDGEQIEAIAPMLALDLITLEDSLRAVKLAGKALGAADEAESLNAEFLGNISRLAETISDHGKTVAVLTSGSETPFIYYDHFLPAALLEKLGFDNAGGEPPNPETGIPLGYRISLEALLEINPDTIILLPGNRQRAFTLNPVWPYLKAVQAGNVYEVSEFWKEGAGPIARSRILSDIERLSGNNAPHSDGLAE